MSIARRHLLGLLAAGAATALAGCGGGGDDRPPTRFVSVLNLNVDFPTADVTFGPTLVSQGLPFQALSLPVEVAHGTYDLGLTEPTRGRRFDFNLGVDATSPTLGVFYRSGASARLVLSPIGIANYFDSSETLIADLSDGAGNVETSSLAFEQVAVQVSRSANARLVLSRASDGVLVYDSALQRRTDALLIYRATQGGLVGVIGVNYGPGGKSAVVWPNTL